MKIYKFKLIKLNFFCYIQTKYLQNLNLISIKTFRICLVLKEYYRQKNVKKILRIIIFSCFVLMWKTVKKIKYNFN